jgi:quinol-cytochrome oxidoreductase complex cytochrome b subunit
LLPFVILALSFIHLIFLHEFGSNNPLGVALKADFIPFTPYYTVKDLFGVVLFFIFAGAFIYFAPNYLGHPDNYILANPLVTPTHIVPE